MIFGLCLDTARGIELCMIDLNFSARRSRTVDRGILYVATAFDHSDRHANRQRAASFAVALAGLAILIAALVSLDTASAQMASAGILAPGNAVVTGFSGAPPPAQIAPGQDPGDLTFIDPNGPSASVFNLQALGAPPQAQVLAEPNPFTVTAAQVGQVFGVTLDNATPPNMYVAATSAYGLPIVVPGQGGAPMRVHQGAPGATFMAALFGPPAQVGGPGSIWRIDGVTGAVSLFANVMLNGVANSGPALGGLAFDAASSSLLVADRQTGMIHRFNLSGTEIGRYDHGVQGLAAAGLPQVPYTPSMLDITNPQFSSDNPATWDYAPTGRRIFGLAVHAGRLYYAVAARLQVWSVGLAPDGSFSSDARPELQVPPAVALIEIAKIIFDDRGDMILAERGEPTGDYEMEAVAQGGSSRVLRYAPNTSAAGAWQTAPDQYAAGFPSPFTNANGGVAVGYGYGVNGNLDSTSCSGFLWSTGENLRNTVDANLAATLAANGPVNLNGLQGNGIGTIAPANVPPLLSYFIDYNAQFDDPAISGYLGDIAILQPCSQQALLSGASGPSATSGTPSAPGAASSFTGQPPPPPLSGGNTPTSPPSAGNTPPPPSGGNTPPPPSGGNTPPPPSGGNTPPPPSGGTTPPPSGGNTPSPPSGGNTPSPPSGGNTPSPSGGNTPSPSGNPPCPGGVVNAITGACQCSPGQQNVITGQCCPSGTTPQLEGIKACLPSFTSFPFNCQLLGEVLDPTSGKCVPPPSNTPMPPPSGGNTPTPPPPPTAAPWICGPNDTYFCPPVTTGQSWECPENEGVTGGCCPPESTAQNDQCVLKSANPPSCGWGNGWMCCPNGLIPDFAAGVCYSPGTIPPLPQVFNCGPTAVAYCPPQPVANCPQGYSVPGGCCVGTAVAQNGFCVDQNPYDGCVLYLANPAQIYPGNPVCCAPGQTPDFVGPGVCIVTLAAQVHQKAMHRAAPSSGSTCAQGYTKLGAGCCLSGKATPKNRCCPADQSPNADGICKAVTRLRNCPSGQTLNRRTNTCETPTCPTGETRGADGVCACPTGQKIDVATGKCVAACSDGEVLNPITGRCERKIATTPPPAPPPAPGCFAGYVLDANGITCVRVTTPPAPPPPAGTTPGPPLLSAPPPPLGSGTTPGTPQNAMPSCTGGKVVDGKCQCQRGEELVNGSCQCLPGEAPVPNEGGCTSNCHSIGGTLSCAPQANGSCPSGSVFSDGTCVPTGQTCAAGIQSMCCPSSELPNFATGQCCRSGTIPQGGSCVTPPVPMRPQPQPSPQKPGPQPQPQPSPPSGGTTTGTPVGVESCTGGEVVAGKCQCPRTQVAVNGKCGCPPGTQEKDGVCSESKTPPAGPTPGTPLKPTCTGGEVFLNGSCQCPSGEERTDRGCVKKETTTPKTPGTTPQAPKINVPPPKLKILTPPPKPPPPPKPLTPELKLPSEPLGEQRR